MTLHERNNRHYLLTCTVGGTPEQIVASVRHWMPARVLFVPSAETRMTVKTVAQEPGLLQPGTWDTLELHDAEDSATVFAGCVALTNRSAHGGEKDPTTTLLWISPAEVAGRLYLLSHAVERPAAVVGQEVGDVFKQQDFRPVIAELPDNPDDVEKCLAAVILETHLRSGDGKGLARETGREHVDRCQIVAYDGKFLDRLVVERRRGEIGGVGLRCEIILLVGPRHLKAFLGEGEAEAAHAGEQAADLVSCPRGLSSWWNSSRLHFLNEKPSDCDDVS